MITNPTALATLQTTWKGAAHMRERARQLALSKFALNPLSTPAFGGALYNIPFLLAFEVLQQVLLEARDEGQFAGAGHRLDELMDGAKTSLPWIDWQVLREGVKRQNEVAHEGRLYGDVHCLKDIANIEAQLIAWGIITSA